MNKTDWFVNITAILLITFLIGFGHMEKDFIIALISLIGAIIGGLLATIGGVYVSKRTFKLQDEKEKSKEDKHIENQKQYLKSALEEIVAKLHVSRKNCRTNKTILNQGVTTAFDNISLAYIPDNLFNIIEKENFINVLNKSDLPVHYIYSLNVLFKQIIELNPRHIMYNYMDKVDDLRNDLRKSEYESVTTIESEAERESFIQEERTYFEDMKEGLLNSSVARLSQCQNLINQTISILDIIINKL